MHAGTITHLMHVRLQASMLVRTVCSVVLTYVLSVMICSAVKGLSIYLSIYYLLDALRRVSNNLQYIHT